MLSHSDPRLLYTEGYALDELAAGRTRAELDKFRVGRQVAAARFGFAYVVESCPEGEWPPIWRKFRKARGAKTGRYCFRNCGYIP